MSSATHRLYTVLEQLDRARIHYTLARVREDAVMVCATVPGRRYEIEVFSNGTMEVEVFGGHGDIGGQETRGRFVGEIFRWSSVHCLIGHQSGPA